jgi:molybdate transport system substrate-binding protein
MRRAWLAVVIALGACGRSPERGSELSVAAAANLTQAFSEIGTAFQKQSGIRVVYSFAATGQLSQQVEQAAPYDVFAAADTEHVDALDQRGFLTPGSRAIYARGKLALWVPPGSRVIVDRIEDLAKPEVRFVAIAKPELAPYGRAAVESLQKLGLWEAVRPKVVYAETISMAKQMAASNSADAAFTAWSLVFRDGGKAISVEEKLHRPIDQALGVVKQSRRQAQARAFADFVLGAKGREILRRNGYDTR